MMVCNFSVLLLVIAAKYCCVKTCMIVLSFHFFLISNFFFGGNKLELCIFLVSNCGICLMNEFKSFFVHVELQV